MGLTAGAMGIKALDSGIGLRKKTEAERVVALAGNPNVGKSTLFNQLTGLSQHTGNWPGKTVTCAQGHYATGGASYLLVDLPGTYSLTARSAEEAVAEDFIRRDDADAVVVVCDATCLERTLILAVQIIERSDNVILCLNLMDEAKKKGIDIDHRRLSERLGIPIVPVSAAKGNGLDRLTAAISTATENGAEQKPQSQPLLCYPESIEQVIQRLAAALPYETPEAARRAAMRLLDGGQSAFAEPAIGRLLVAAKADLAAQGITEEGFRDCAAACAVQHTEALCRNVVRYRQSGDYNAADRKIDRLLLGGTTGVWVMLLLLLLIFWLTAVAADTPSRLLSEWLFSGQTLLYNFFVGLGAPQWLTDALVLGVYRVTAWVVAVMLPPMAVFFPLFTLLEDLGYLPRVAFRLDSRFKKCRSCGKQSLTMCMGLGCNAAGVVGCRIIDSPRERLIAMITNSFVPCNGRLSMLIALITMFFVFGAGSVLQSATVGILLTGVILLGVAVTFAVSRALSATILKGVSSSFLMELPPYRRPQIKKIIVHSIVDRTLFVLARAVCVAAPAGLLIFALANITVGGASVLSLAAGWLDPFGRLVGMDGVILLAFILGSPANEIVLPIMMMIYLRQGTLAEAANLFELRALLAANGWTAVTALCVVLFSLMHWPCATTLWTIKKETRSLKWTTTAFVVPTAVGLSACFLVATVARLIELL